jgi:hypothetical protein
VAGAAALPGTDPITLGSIIYDFWWQSGVTKVGGGGTPANGGTLESWVERYVGEVATTSGSPYQTYSTTLGIRNGTGVYMDLATSVGLTPPFTVYVLCTYGGTNIYPVGGLGSGDLSNLSVTAGLSLMQDSTSLVTLSGTVTGTGSKLFRWRVNASGTGFFKDDTAVEENVGAFGLGNAINWAAIFGIPGTVTEAADNYTRRITAFSADIVTGGQSTAVETYINAAG